MKRLMNDEEIAKWSFACHWSKFNIDKWNSWQFEYYTIVFKNSTQENVQHGLTMHFLKRMLNVRLTHGKRINRVMHV